MNLTLTETTFALLAQGGGAGGGLMSFLPLILFFAAIYFLMIRPQQQKQKQHREMLAALKQGDKIISAGGIHGTVMSVRDDLVTVRVADNTQLVFSKGSIASKADGAAPGPSQPANAELIN